MRKIILIVVAGLMIAGVAYCMVDKDCLSNCILAGNDILDCRYQCSRP